MRPANGEARYRGAYGGAVQEAPPDVRGAFLTKTYGLLLASVMGFVVLEVVWFLTPIAGILLQVLGAAGRFGWLAVMVGLMGTHWVAQSVAASSRNVPLQLLALAGFVAAYSLVFVPLVALALSVTSAGDVWLIPKALFFTISIFATLSAIVFVTRKDFRFVRSALIFGSIAALVFVLASFVMGFSVGALFFWAMIALTGGYVLYDTSNVLHHYGEHQYVLAAIQLFASFATLLWYVLRLLSRRN
jgi:FtsH-binding integral membrane protein